MKIGLINIHSLIHDKKRLNTSSNDFLSKIMTNSDIIFENIEITEQENFEFCVIFVETGGTEGIFKQIYQQLKPPYILLTSGMNNSLAASMEILSFLKNNNLPGEIIHGNFEYMIKQLQTFYKAFHALNEMAGTKLGLIGEPSDWLIASDIDEQAINNQLGIEVVHIPMSELTEEIAKTPMNLVVNSNIAKTNSPYYEQAVTIYQALRKIVERHQLSGLSLRCFDLLSTCNNTGCLALAILNSEGIVSGCEGDMQALISMYLLNKLTTLPVFMANPSFIDVPKKEGIFAHCTIPLNMPLRYQYDTHFESGIGLAIKGELEQGRYTIFKTNKDLSKYYVDETTLSENLHKTYLCRTQIKLAFDNEIEYFLNHSIGNHHLIVKGEHRNLIEFFFKIINEKAKKC